METALKIRRKGLIENKGIKTIVRELHLSRNTVRKYLRDEHITIGYKRSRQPRPKLGEYCQILDELLLEENQKHKKYRKTAKKIYEELQDFGYEGGYDTVRRYIKYWKRTNSEENPEGYIPLHYEAGSSYQFDWSTENLILGGISTKVYVAHMTLCYSNMTFSMIFPRASQEMVIAAHEAAFEFFGGCCKEGKYDNMSTAVAKILNWRERQLTKLFSEMCLFYLVEPVMCNPAAGWEKGKVERAVRNARQQFFSERNKFESIDDANDWLLTRCIGYSKQHKHPEFKEKTIWEVFLEEKPFLVPVRGKFDGYRSETVRVSKTCLIQFDKNQYSVPCTLACKNVEIKIYANTLKVMYNNEEYACLHREFGKNKIIYNPMDYFPLLLRKPGAIKDGAPFKDWKLPEEIQQVKELLKIKYKDWERQFVSILSALPEVGLEKITEACRIALCQNMVSRDVIIGIINRKGENCQPDILREMDNYPKLQEEPTADCSRYNTLLGAYHVA